MADTQSITQLSSAILTNTNAVQTTRDTQSPQFDSLQTPMPDDLSNTTGVVIIPTGSTRLNPENFFKNTPRLKSYYEASSVSDQFKDLSVRAQAIETKASGLYEELNGLHRDNFASSLEYAKARRDYRAEIAALRKEEADIERNAKKILRQISKEAPGGRDAEFRGELHELQNELRSFSKEERSMLGSLSYGVNHSNRFGSGSVAGGTHIAALQEPSGTFYASDSNIGVARSAVTSADSNLIASQYPGAIPGERGGYVIRRTPTPYGAPELSAATYRMFANSFDERGQNDTRDYYLERTTRAREPNLPYNKGAGTLRDDGRWDYSAEETRFQETGLFDYATGQGRIGAFEPDPVDGDGKIATGPGYGDTAGAGRGSETARTGGGGQAPGTTSRTMSRNATSTARVVSTHTLSNGKTFTLHE